TAIARFTEEGVGWTTQGAPSPCSLHACLASPAGRKKIAHRFIGGCGSGVGQVPEGRKNATVPGGTRSAPRSVPTDKSVGYSRSPRWAGSDACKVQRGQPHSKTLRQADAH